MTELRENREASMLRVSSHHEAQLYLHPMGLHLDFMRGKSKGSQLLSYGVTTDGRQSEGRDT